MAVEVHRAEQTREERRARVKQKMIKKMMNGALRCSFDGWRKVVLTSRLFEMKEAKEMLHFLKSLTFQKMQHLLRKV
jgi:hypothetical protein